jgi:crotonobetainyl-CoA:carnitine CoA-transferase CaiB-like acyl-CoA transferase
LLHRAKTGEGLYVTTSLLAAAIASLANQATNWLMQGYIPEPMGTMHPNIAPYGDIFYTKDEKAIVMAVGTERQFENMCNILQINELLKDIRFIGNAARVQNRADLKLLMQKAFATFEQNELMDAFRSNGVPAGRIRNMQEVFEQEKAKNLILTEKMDDNSISQRVKTVVFEIRH